MDLASTIVFAGGEYRRYDEAKVGLLTHGLQYGTGCFEGIRGHWIPDERELYLVQLKEHYTRLHSSAKILLMTLPHTVDELVEITVNLCVRNRFQTDIYVRPCLFKSAETIGVRLHDIPDAFAIIPVPFGSYITTSHGLRLCVSSWRRAEDSMAPPRAKITGLYVNSALAKSEALMNGYDEAIMLTGDGDVAEGSAENLFIVRNGTLLTPDPSANVLEGCTRRSVMELAAREFNVPVVERQIARGELYAADEVFLTGTAAGIVHVASIDERVVGSGEMGPITAKIAKMYARIVRGEEPRYRHWVTPTYAPRAQSATP
ncbi:MAG: branched-chain amino acid transaminase [Vulcanimicrobiaceae bacterium]